MNIRPTDIMNLILQSDNTDFMFKMNFLVLFVNLMADCNSIGSCSLSFIAKLKNESMVTKINWSKYIFDKVKTSKEKWRRDNDMCFYSDPLTYLTLLYVEATISNKLKMESTKPALTIWNIGHLRKRETTELENGGFGLLPIKDKYKVRRPFVKGECSKFPHTPPQDMGKPEYIRFLDIVMKQLLSAKDEAEKWLESATSKFPNDDSFDIYKAQLDNLFNTDRWQTNMPGNSSSFHEKAVNDCLEMVVFEDVDATTPIDACWESPTFVAEVGEIVDIEAKKSEEKKSCSKSIFQDFAVDPPAFDLGISPEKPKYATPTEKHQSQSVGSVLRSSSSQRSNDKGKKAVTFSPVPMTSYFDNTEGTVNNAAPIQVAFRENRRVTKSGEHLRSPYVHRCVDFNVTMEERRVHEWALSAIGDPM
ncbi:hypothetical protein L6452_03144 [Arctium lappa]|uniref:Uncharacterized protein n=1 Tax=Arctium lappa TaxID=4217 RepID=A0ACB9FML5_ARCLA|nr:hypothetical protein L6452_03144 [Arctium lappa]